MRLDKPQVLRTQVTALNTQTGKSKTVSFYDTTPELFFDNVERMAKADFAKLEQVVDQLDAVVNEAARPLVAQVREFVDHFRPASAAA